MTGAKVRCLFYITVLAAMVAYAFTALIASRSGGLVCQENKGVSYSGIPFVSRFVLYKSDPDTFPGRLSGIMGVYNISCRFIRPVGQTTIYSYKTLGYCYGTAYALLQMRLPEFSHWLSGKCMDIYKENTAILFRPVPGDIPLIDIIQEYEKGSPK